MHDKQQRSRKRKRILFTCLGVSLTIHLVALFVFYKNPPSYIAQIRASFTKNFSSFEALDPLKKEDILEEVFQDFTSLPSQFKEPFDKEKKALSIALSPLVEELKQIESSPASFAINQISLPLSIENPSEEKIENATALIESPYTLSSPSLSTNKELSLPISSMSYDLTPYESDTSHPHYAISLEIPEDSPSLSQQLGLSSYQENALSLPPVSYIAMPLDKESLAPSKQPLMIFKSFQEPVADWVVSSTKPSSLKKIEEYALPDMLATLDWGAHFNVETEVMPDPEGEGYIFLIRLQPRVDLSSKKMRQNFTFLIDRSNSIDKHYYESFKKAVFRTLAFLPEGDRFNIIVFDRKISRLSEQHLPISKSSIHYAKQFLAKQENGTLFTATEIYPVLEKALPSYAPDEEMNTAFILTDGNTLLSLKKQKKALQRLIEKNSGKLSLHTAAAGISNNIVLLDLLSSANRGSLFYSRTYASFPRKFVNAVTRLKNPLLKDISFKYHTSDPNVKIALYPSSYATPALTHLEPYLIIGKSPTLADFTLFIEGRNRDQWVSINKEISLAHSKQGGAFLEKKWALQKTRLCYESFLKEGSGSYLKEAKERLLTCSDLPINSK